MTKTASLAFRISDGMKAALEQEAAADDRSVSSLVERVLRGWLEQRGHQVSTTVASVEGKSAPSPEATLDRMKIERRSVARDRARAETRRRDTARPVKPK